VFLGLLVLRRFFVVCCRGAVKPPSGGVSAGSFYGRCLLPLRLHSRASVRPFVVVARFRRGPGARVGQIYDSACAWLVAGRLRLGGLGRGLCVSLLEGAGTSLCCVSALSCFVL